MGNSHTIHNAVPVSNPKSPPDTRTSIISNLNLIENSLANFDVQLVASKNMIEFKHNTMKSKLLKKFQNAKLYTDDIIQKKTEMKRSIIKAKRFSSIYAG
jgi:hypothetical protein